MREGISGERQRTVGSLTGTGYHGGGSARALALSENFCMFGMCRLEWEHAYALTYGVLALSWQGNIFVLTVHAFVVSVIKIEIDTNIDNIT